jgi:hypothetical protein
MSTANVKNIIKNYSIGAPAFKKTACLLLLCGSKTIVIPEYITCQNYSIKEKQNKA